MEFIGPFIFLFIIISIFILNAILASRKNKMNDQKRIMPTMKSEQINKYVKNDIADRWEGKFTEYENMAEISKHHPPFSTDHYQTDSITNHPAFQKKHKNAPRKQKKEEASSSKKQSIIDFRTKEDARRAFIYSEIFNRKY